MDVQENLSDNTTSENSTTINYSRQEADTMLVEQWKRMLDSAENNSERRIKINNFYLAINTLLLGSCTFFSAFQTRLLAVSGVLISILWCLSLVTYRITNSTRYGVIREIEKQMRCSPITDEYYKLENKPIYLGNTAVEIIIPIVFIFLFLITAYYAPQLIKVLEP